MEQLTTLCLFVGWFCFNGIANIASKKFLNETLDPVGLSCVSFLVGAILVVLVRQTASNGHPRPGILQRLLPCALLHFSNTVLTFQSMQLGTITATYMIKAAEPVSTAVLSFVILHTREPAAVYASLVMLSIGVCLLVYKSEGQTFAPNDFVSISAACASNVASSLRNVIFKNDLNELGMTPLEQYAYLSGLAACFTVPLWLSLFTSGFLPYGAAVREDSAALWWGLAAGSLHFAYNLCSFFVLKRVSPVTHSVGLVAKRVFLVLMAAIEFGFDEFSSVWRKFGFLIANVSILAYIREKQKVGHLTLRATAKPYEENRRVRLILVVAVSLLTAVILSFSVRNHTARLVTAAPITSDHRLQCIKQLRWKVISSVQTLLLPNQPFVLLDLPIHWNMGDTFIWYGEKLLFQSLGRSPVETDSVTETNLTLVANVIKSGTILLHGGGNFGDTWREKTDFKLDVVKQFPKHRIVFLPQSMHYWNESVAQSDARVFNAHKDITMLMRDSISVENGRRLFPNANVLLCPDAAFVIGNLFPNREVPIIDVLFLLRTDRESALGERDYGSARQALTATGFSSELWDFPVNWGRSPFNWSVAAPDYFVNRPGRGDRAASITQLAVTVFSRARLVITDRLHATILSFLMGKPHIFLDNNYGKIQKLSSSIYTPPECSELHRNAFPAQSLDDAVKIAQLLLRQASS